MIKVSLKETGKAVKGSVASKAEVAAIVAQDRKWYLNMYKREPMPAGTVLVPKHIMVNGIPHKSVNGQLVALTKVVK